MSVIVRIPSPLLKLTQNKGEVEVEGNNVSEVFDNLEKGYSGIKERLYDENNSLRRFINIYINDEDIRFMDGEKTLVNNGDTVSIIPAIAGGV